MNGIGEYCWVGTIAEFLSLDRGRFVDAMCSGSIRIHGCARRPSQGQRAAWRDEFKHLKRELARLDVAFHNLHIVFEYVLPGHENKTTGEVEYFKIPDAMIFGRSGVFVLEFKQREPPPFDGFAKETRGYLRLIEKWHPYVPRMTARGALVLTHAVNFGKKYPRVKAISPDRIPAMVRNIFGVNHDPVSDPVAFLKAIAHHRIGTGDSNSKHHFGNMLIP